MPKTRLNLSLDPDLVDFLREFAAENRTTSAEVINQYLLALKRRSLGDPTEIILSNPALREALFEAQARIRGGAAEWFTYDEVFGD